MAGSLRKRDGFVRAGFAGGGWLGTAIPEGIGELPSQPLVRVEQMSKRMKRGCNRLS